MSKFLVTLPAELLSELNEEARRRATSRSAVFEVATRRWLARRNADQIAYAIARSERRFGRAGCFEAGDVLRSDRDSRW